MSILSRLMYCKIEAPNLTDRTRKIWNFQRLDFHINDDYNIFVRYFSFTEHLRGSARCELLIGRRTRDLLDRKL